MKFKNRIAKSFVSPAVFFAPIGWLCTLVVYFCPWWATGLFFGICLFVYLYDKRIYTPCLQREFIVRAMFGFVTCPHGRYLPDTFCDSCADRWFDVHFPLQQQEPIQRTLH